MNTTHPEVVTGELVPAQARTLFATSDPVEVRKTAERIATDLKETLHTHGMVLKIGRSEHVLIDGWQTLGAMLGVSPHVVWSKPLDGGHGWEARAEARTVDGRIVGSAEAMVTRDERNWKRGEDYALRSMAQTRAMSKALRGPLGFVFALGGLNTTPAEELDPEQPVKLPDWASNIPEDAIDRFGDNLRQILTGTDDPERAALDVGNGIVAFCDGTVPACVARLAKLAAQQADPNPAPGVAEPADLGPPAPHQEGAA